MALISASEETHQPLDKVLTCTDRAALERPRRRIAETTRLDNISDDAKGSGRKEGDEGKRER